MVKDNKTLLSKLSPDDLLFGIIAVWPRDHIHTDRLYNAMRKTVASQGLGSSRNFYPNSQSFETALDLAVVGQVLSEPMGEHYAMISSGMRAATMKSMRRNYCAEVIDMLRKLSLEIYAAAKV